ncbi:MAG: hypothetical protein ACXVXZ_11535 [Mycobacteriaceae bacterium]
MFRAPTLRSLPPFGWTLLTAAGLLLTALVTRPVSDPSPWLHLKVGQFLLDGHRFASHDPFAPYASREYEPTQWLPSVLATGLYDRWGLPAVAWSRAAGITVFVLCLVLATRRLARPALALGATALALLGAWPSLTERPQLVGFIMIVVSTAAWWRSAEDGRPRWWLVPFTWVAACVHGVWSIGLGLGALIVVGLVLQGRFTREARARLTAVLAASALAAGLTPLGPKLLLSPFEVGGNARQFVGEWMASSARTPSVALSLAVLAGVFALWVMSRRRPPAWQLMLWVTAVILLLAMQRTVAIGALVGALLLADAAETYLADRSPASVAAAEPRSPGGRREWAVLVGSAAVAVALAIPLAALWGQQPQGVPTRLITALRALPAGTHVISDGDLSGWLMFQAPHVEPVFDIRIEVYAPEHVHGFIDALQAQPGWSAYLQRTQTHAALLKSDSPLVSALHDQWHWDVAKADRGYVLMEPQ